MFPNPVWIGVMAMMYSTTSGTKEIALVAASVMLAGMPKTYQESAQVIAPCTNMQTTPKEDVSHCDGQLREYADNTTN